MELQTDYIKTIESGERRYFPSELEVEEREEGKRGITGYAAVFNKPSEDFGGWVEEIDERAFDDVLDNDVFALFNHDMNKVLGRNGVNLKLSVNKTGLKYRVELPNTATANEMLELIRSGIIDKSSFAFTVKEQRWIDFEGDKPSVRRILKINRLYDVSPVTQPAYPDTSVGTRSFKAELEKNKPGENWIEYIKFLSITNK